MGSFKPTTVKGYPRLGTGQTPDNIFWSSFKFPVTTQEFSLIDCVDFSPDGSHFIATSSVNVKMYNANSHAVVKSFSRFTKTAYGGRFRAGDGRLLCAGSEDAVVRVFDTSGRHALRHMKGHSAAVHRCCFTADGRQVVSFGDDRQVALWDVGTGCRQLLLTSSSDGADGGAGAGGHTDYVRAGVAGGSPQQRHLVVSGGYDHRVCVWDTRVGEGGGARGCLTMSMDHGAPVESVVLLRSGGILVSTGGTETRVWDIMCGGRLLTTLSHHTKTVTCSVVCCDGSRLLTGSLDRRLKVYDTATYQPVHTLNYSSPILSVAVSPDNDKLVVGMSDGLVSIQERRSADHHYDSATLPTSSPHIAATHRKQPSAPNDASSSTNAAQKPTAAAAAGASDLAPYDRHLRRFEHSLALSCALERSVTRRRPQCTVAVLHELMRRGVLETAVAGGDHERLTSLCRFLARHLHQPRHTATLTAAAHCLLTVYAGDAATTPLLIHWLRPALSTHVHNVAEMQRLHGALDMLVTGARLAHSSGVSLAAANEEDGCVAAASSAGCEDAVSGVSHGKHAAVSDNVITQSA